MNSEELTKIIIEYEVQNNIECISEEELLDLIPESALYPKLYQSHDGCPITIISDYDAYMLNEGINFIEKPAFNIFDRFRDKIIQTQDGIDLGDADLLNEADQLNDIKDEFSDGLADKYYSTITGHNE